MAFIHLEVYRNTEAANMLATSDNNKGVSTLSTHLLEEVVIPLFQALLQAERGAWSVLRTHTRRECVKEKETGYAPQKHEFINID